MPRRVSDDYKMIGKLGYEQLCANHRKMAKEVNRILESGCTPNISQQCQDKKTVTTCDYVSNFFLLARKKDGKTFVIIWMTAKSDDVLRNRNWQKVSFGQDDDGKWRGMNLPHYIEEINSQNKWRHIPDLGGVNGTRDCMYFIHRSQLPRLMTYAHDQLMAADYVLFIDDEADESFIRDGQIADFLDKFGVNITQHRDEWKNPKNPSQKFYFVGITSTDAFVSAEESLERPGGSLFQRVYMPPNPETYTGIETGGTADWDLDNEKFEVSRASPFEWQWAPNIVEKTNIGYAVTEEFGNMMARFRRDCMKHGNGSFLLRQSGDGKIEAICNFLQTLKIEYHVYDYNTNNIKEFITDLAKPHSRPVVRIIKRSFAAGVSLITQKYIRGRYEPSNSPDTLYQELGRSFGHNNDSVYAYPIHCNLSIVKDWAVRYRKAANSQLLNPMKSRLTKTFGSKNMMMKIVFDHAINDDLAANEFHSRYCGNRSGGRRAWVSLNRQDRDICRQILNGVSFMGDAERGAYIMVKLDAPQPGHDDSWRRLMSSEYGKYRGQWLVFRKEQKTSAEINYHRKKSLLSRED